ncbi:MAG: Lrp/AsnC family transcriptional regulator [Synechococcales cyanobacterium RM1_1_8]|nr:Lrp/AsnC family transcriptional regulator [Synechococcales cyanobacterium RM1_1_8]
MDQTIDLDATGWILLEALQADARLSFAELGRRTNLSAPAVAERVRRLEEAGWIVGYRAELNPIALGYSLTALIDLTTTPQQYSVVLPFLQRLEAVRCCYHVTGQGSFRLEVVARSIPHLEKIIEQLSRYGQTATAIVLSQPVRKTAFAKPEPWSDA